MPYATPQPAGRVLDVVTELLESGGDDSVQLREVARRSRIGLATIYRMFPTRDALIVAAIERWMAADAWGGLEGPTPGEPLYDAMMRMFRHIYGPWERCPAMLRAFYRACGRPGGERLKLQGANAVMPVVDAVLRDADPAYRDDVSSILTNVAYGAMARFAAGELDVTEILPSLERAVARLSVDNRAAAEAARPLPGVSQS